MRWSASYRERAGLPTDTIDKADTTRRFSTLSIVSALSVVSCPPRMAAAGSGADAPPSVDCVSNVTAGERTDEPSPPPTTEEPDEPLWPDPGTPERERLDRKNAAMCAGLLAGYHRHRAAPAVHSELPTAPCSTCGRGLWWRVSTIEPGGPGPWCCHECHRPDPAVWIDATALPLALTAIGVTDARLGGR